MTDITIPPEALEEAAEDLFHMQYDDSKGSWADAPEWLKITIRAEARAACLAMLKAWPGSEYVYRQPHRRAVSYSKPAIIIPLTENTNDKG